MTSSLNALLNPPVRDVLRSLRLPPELLPADWPLRDLTAAIEAVDTHLYPAVRSYVDSVLERA